jgi:hypothetical protein
MILNHDIHQTIRERLDRDRGWEEGDSREDRKQNKRGRKHAMKQVGIRSKHETYQNLH